MRIHRHVVQAVHSSQFTVYSLAFNGLPLNRVLRYVIQACPVALGLWGLREQKIKQTKSMQQQAFPGGHPCQNVAQRSK
jgi:hypothetical protein